METPNVLGLPADTARAELLQLGYEVRLIPCDSSPPDSGQSVRIVRQELRDGVAVLTYGVFKTTVD